MHHVLRVAPGLMRGAVMGQVKLAVSVERDERKRRKQTAPSFIPERHAEQHAVHRIVRQHAHADQKHHVGNRKRADPCPFDRGRPQPIPAMGIQPGGAGHRQVKRAEQQGEQQ